MEPEELTLDSKEPGLTWLKCPNGCIGFNGAFNTEQTMGLYIRAGIDKAKAYVDAWFSCGVCKLRIALNAQKTGKEEIISQEVVKEWRYS